LLAVVVVVVFVCALLANLRVCCDFNCNVALAKMFYGLCVSLGGWVILLLLLLLLLLPLLLRLIHLLSGATEQRSDLNLYLALFWVSNGGSGWVALRLDRKTFYSRDMLHFS